MADLLALGQRDGLPDDLTWLLRAYPRGSWAGGLGQVGQFWLSRHAMFREVHGTLLAETRAFAAGDADPAVFGRRFHRFASFFLGELDTHHTVEDHHYFPRLARLEPRLQGGFDLLDADHHALHDGIEGLADAANALLRGLGQGGGIEEAKRAADRVDGFGNLLDRHLDDEEDIVAPVLMAHGEASLE
jgi:hypothetical protein